VLYAIAAFLGAAYLCFLITIIPEALSLDDRWPIKETQALRLIDPATEPLLVMTFRGPGVASVSAGGGSRIIEPRPGMLRLLSEASDFKPLSLGKRIDIRIQGSETGTASVTIALKRGGAQVQSGVQIRPVVGDGEKGVRMEASGASMVISVDWSSESSDAQSGLLLSGERDPPLELGRAVVEVPEGTRLYVGGPETDTTFNLGDRLDRLSAGGLRVRGLQIVSGEGERLISLACGAQWDGALRSPGPFGGLRAERCANTMHVESLRLNEDSTVAVSGPAFFMKDGVVNYWPLLPSLLDNLVIKAALTGLVSALIAWLTFHLHRARSSDQPRRRRRRRSRSPASARDGRSGASAEPGG
jgi:hypothetical protein